MSIELGKIEEVTTQVVACNGSLKELNQGHPKVWLKICLEKGSVTCPYCEKTFVLNIKK